MLEVVVSLTLVATILLVSLTASANMLNHRATAAEGVRAQVLAGYFLDEISTLPYREPFGDAGFGPETGESGSDRTTLDDIDDYHGFSCVSPTFRDGETILGYENWTVNVRIASLGISGTSLRFESDASSQFRLIGVTVINPQGQQKTFRTLVSITPTDQPAASSYERMRRVDVRFSDDRQLQVLVPLRNKP
ncbi:MAG: hypothetical protein KDB00_13790 [Planctomycetales bacterium]|nr:hypothetical protein [Planctomycetales bacterium]